MLSNTHKVRWLKLGAYETHLVSSGTPVDQHYSEPACVATQWVRFESPEETRFREQYAGKNSPGLGGAYFVVQVLREKRLTPGEEPAD